MYNASLRPQLSNLEPLGLPLYPYTLGLPRVASTHGSPHGTTAHGTTVISVSGSGFGPDHVASNPNPNPNPNSNPNPNPNQVRTMSPVRWAASRWRPLSSGVT